jgi:hypothetical protein
VKFFRLARTSLFGEIIKFLFLLKRKIYQRIREEEEEASKRRNFFIVRVRIVWFLFY